MSTARAPRESQDEDIERERGAVHDQLDELLHRVVREHDERAIGWRDVTSAFGQLDFRGGFKNMLAFVFGANHAMQGLGYDARSVDHLSSGERQNMLGELEKIKATDQFRRKMMASVARYQLEESLVHEQSPKKEMSSPSERAIEFLEQRVQQGDILLVSQGGKKEMIIHELFEILQRRLRPGRTGRNPFHGTHAIVATSGGLIHITQQGKHQKNIRDTFAPGEYNAITVLRLPDIKDAQEFAVRAQSFADRIEGYNIGGMVKAAINPAAETVDGKTCICTDYVSKSLDPDDVKLKTIADMAQSDRFQIVYSIDLGHEAAK